MSAEPATHPPADALAAFGLGRLDDATADTVAQHLDTCPDCRKRVAAADADSFVRKLRSAGSVDATPKPGYSSTGGFNRDIPGTVPPSGPVPAAGPLPPGLADHPQYEIVRELGRGGMGVVYLARNKLMGRDEVLKVVNKQLLGRSGAAERFLREIRSAASLNHPNVVTAYSALQLGELLVLAMEYVPGEDLSRVVKARGPLPVPNACYYAYQAANGLQHAHEQGMVHRDIKPHNLILTKGGKKPVVKVLDFGLAKATSEKSDEDLTGSGATLGTPDYIAPEQARDAASADIRADVYSLGCTLYHLLTGRPPFRADSLFEVLYHHQHTPPPAANADRPGVPAELAAVVARMMAKDPAARFQTPGEVAKALAPFFRPASAASLPVAPRVAAGTVAPSATTTIAVPRRRPWWGLPAVVLAFAAAGLLGAWAGGVFKVKTAAGVLVVEVDKEGADVFIDGEKVTVTGADGKPVEVTVPPGVHKVRVTKDGFTAFGDEVTVGDGKKQTVKARLVRAGPPTAGAGGDPGALFRPGSRWVGVAKNRVVHGATKPNLDLTIEVKTRDGEAFTAEGWADQGKARATYRGTVRGDRVSFTVAAALAGVAEEFVDNMLFEGTLRGDRLTGIITAPKTDPTHRSEFDLAWEMPADGFAPLFAGTLDPTIWVESGDGTWRVDGDALIGRGGPNLRNPAVLTTRRTDYRNFTLRVVVAEPDAARMIGFRGTVLGGETACYAVTVGGRGLNNDRVAAGSLSKWCTIKGDGLVGTVEMADPVPLPPGEPYTLEVTADGGAITSFVNGRKVAELPQDTTDLLSTGAILLTCRDGTTPRYKRIEIRELPAENAVPPAATGTTVLHRWRLTVMNGRPRNEPELQLVSGGRILGPAGGEADGTWRLTGGGRKLVLRWKRPDPRAPGGVWIDTYTSPDGINFQGTNNDNPPASLRSILSGP